MHIWCLEWHSLPKLVLFSPWLHEMRHSEVNFRKAQTHDASRIVLTTISYQSSDWMLAYKWSWDTRIPLDCSTWFDLGRITSGWAWCHGTSTVRFIPPALLRQLLSANSHTTLMVLGEPRVPVFHHVGKTRSSLSYHQPNPPLSSSRITWTPWKI